MQEVRAVENTVHDERGVEIVPNEIGILEVAISEGGTGENALQAVNVFEAAVGKFCMIKNYRMKNAAVEGTVLKAGTVKVAIHKLPLPQIHLPELHSWKGKLPYEQGVGESLLYYFSQIQRMMNQTKAVFRIDCHRLPGTVRMGTGLIFIHG